MFYFRHSRLFEHAFKEHVDVEDNSPVQVYVNRINIWIVFEIKTGYKLELSSPKTMKLAMKYVVFQSTKVILVDCN